MYLYHQEHANTNFVLLKSVFYYIGGTLKQANDFSSDFWAHKLLWENLKKTESCENGILSEFKIELTIAINFDNKTRVYQDGFWCLVLTCDGR